MKNILTFFHYDEPLSVLFVIYQPDLFRFISNPFMIVSIYSYIKELLLAFLTVLSLFREHINYII